MKINKNIAKALSLGILLTNIPINSFANNIDIENKYSNEISSIKSKEDLQKSAQKAVKSGEVDTWIEGFSNMPFSNDNFTASVVGEKIYCIGGSNGHNKLEIYDTKTDSWNSGASMPVYRRELASSVIGDNIYIFGGTNASGGYKDVYKYDTKNNVWSKCSDMPNARFMLSTSVVNDKIYVFGGYHRSIISNVDVYNPQTDTWETKSSMPTPRIGVGTAVVDNKVYVIGGTTKVNGEPINTVEIYDTETDSWTNGLDIPTARKQFSIEVFNEKIYCFGGNAYTSWLSSVEIYDTNANEWKNGKDMPIKRGYTGSGIVNGLIYILGGSNTNGTLDIVQAYVAKESPDDKAKSSVSKAEETREPSDIENARNEVNKLPEGDLKQELQNRLDAIIPNLTLTSNSATANVDIYINSTSTLTMTLDTNNITFEGFSGVEDTIKENALNVTVKSSLPYELNAYLLSEFNNINGDKVLDKSVLNIKANGTDDYKTFEDVGITPIQLLDNQDAGEPNNHGIDFKLDSDVPYEDGNYKTVVKFEAKQK